MNNVLRIALLLVVCICAKDFVLGIETQGGKEEKAIEEANKAVVRKFITGLNEMDLSVLDKYVRPDIIQHDPAIADGRDGIREFVKQEYADQLAAATTTITKFEILRLIADGNYVVVHKRRNNLSAIHIYRMEGGMVAENWRLAAELTPEVLANSKNPHPLF